MATTALFHHVAVGSQKAHEMNNLLRRPLLHR